MSRSTWKSPYHLFILEIWMATSSDTCICFAGAGFFAALEAADARALAAAGFAAAFLDAVLRAAGLVLAAAFFA
jgi:hypothetical protein